MGEWESGRVEEREKSPPVRSDGMPQSGTVRVAWRLTGSGESSRLLAGLASLAQSSSTSFVNDII